MVEKGSEVEAEEKESEMGRQVMNLERRKRWKRRLKEEDLRGLNTWKGWKEKDYQMQLCMDTWGEKEAEEDKGRDEWTILEKI